MSTVWGIKYRLLLEELEHLADWLGEQQPPEPLIVEEQTIRLLMGVVRLLRQHRVNHRGRCRFCGWTRWGWRIWRRRPQCTVYRALDFAMAQPIDVVWWQLFKDTGRDVALDEVREWMQQREQTPSEPPAENNDVDDDTVVLNRIPE